MSIVCALSTSLYPRLSGSEKTSIIRVVGMGRGGWSIRVVLKGALLGLFVSFCRSVEITPICLQLCNGIFYWNCWFMGGSALPTPTLCTNFFKNRSKIRPIKVVWTVQDPWPSRCKPINCLSIDQFFKFWTLGHKNHKQSVYSLI